VFEHLQRVIDNQEGRYSAHAVSLATTMKAKLTDAYGTMQDGTV